MEQLVLIMSFLLKQLTPLNTVDQEVLYDYKAGLHGIRNRNVAY